MHVGPNVIHSFMYKYIYTFIHACIWAYALCICMCVFTCSILGYSFLPLFFLSFLVFLLPSLLSYFLASWRPSLYYLASLLPSFLPSNSNSLQPSFNPSILSSCRPFVNCFPSSCAFSYESPIVV